MGKNGKGEAMKSIMKLGSGQGLQDHPPKRDGAQGTTEQTQLDKKAPCPLPQIRDRQEDISCFAHPL
jgi:hypothetical protein